MVSFQNVAFGVPQGFIFGPLVFILYIDDTRHVVKHLTIKIFADNIYDDCLKLKENLSSVYNWFLKWHSKLNPKKCEAVNFTNKRNSMLRLAPIMPA